MSKGIARYGYTGTNAKLGTNLVHHSHQKLLITSNTFTGNTQFDDFADQGNYWNQQPLSYYFDGTDDYIDVVNGVSSYNALSSHYMTICAWVKPNINARGSNQNFVASDTISTGSSYQYYLLTHSSGTVGALSLIHI